MTVPEDIILNKGKVKLITTIVGKHTVLTICDNNVTTILISDGATISVKNVDMATLCYYEYNNRVMALMIVGNKERYLVKVIFEENIINTITSISNNSNNYKPIYHSKDSEMSGVVIIDENNKPLDTIYFDF